MPYVVVHADLNSVKNKAAFNLTFRQIVCFTCAGIVAIPAYLFARNTIGNSMAALLLIGLALPFFFVAMFEKNSLPAEKILLNIARTRLWPGVRPYRTENLYKVLSKGGNDIDKTKTTAKARQKYVRK